MAAVKTSADPKRRTDFLDSMEEESRRVSEHLERRERRLGLKARRSASGAGDIMNGYSFSEGSGAEAGWRRRRVNRHPRQFRPTDDDRSSTGSSETRSPSPGPRSAPAVHSPRPFLNEQLQTARASSLTPEGANPRPRPTPDRLEPTPNHQDDPEPRKLKDSEDTSEHSRRAASSSPLKQRTPPPVAPKPKSRHSPGPPSPQHREPMRKRAGSAPPNWARARASKDKQKERDSREVLNEETRQTPHNKYHSNFQQEMSELEGVEEVVTLEELGVLESLPTPVPTDVLEHSPSPPLTPEHSEPLVIHQQHREKSTTPDSSSSTLSALSPAPSSLEVIESRSKEAVSPGIIEISGNFPFKRRTLEQRMERSVSPIAEEEMRGEKSLSEEEVTGEEANVETALLEAMMEEEAEGENEGEVEEERREEEEGQEEGEEVEEREREGEEEREEGERGEEGEGEEVGESEGEGGEEVGEGEREGEGEEVGEGEGEREGEVGGGEEDMEEVKEENKEGKQVREPTTDLVAETECVPSENKQGEGDKLEREAEEHTPIESDISERAAPQPAGSTRLPKLPVTENPMTQELAADPQGPEIKSLPLMSPATGRRGTTSPGQRRRRSQEEMALMVKDLQLQLREREEELGRQRRSAERDARERHEQVCRLTREGQKLEREKWELLKRARDGAERSLSLRTQLDQKESQLRSLQADLVRTRDEMMSVKSANTSLRALLSELRAPKPSRDVGIQAELGGGTLKRNHSMELAVQDLSRPSSDVLERGIDFRASTTHLDRGAYHRISNCSAMSEGWPIGQGVWDRQRDSGRWDREQSVTSVTSSQYEPASREETPLHSPMLGKKSKKKKGQLFGKLRKSTGKRGSTPTIIDGVDLSQSSLIQGQSHTPIPFPYQARASVDTQEHWRVLDEAQHIPFQHWNERAIVAWVATGLGMSQYSGAIRDHVTTGNAMLALSDSDMEKKLGVANALHRRKLRLAIEEKRRPDIVKYPMAGRVDCGWLAEVWMADIGLPHFSDAMATHLVDGRVLESLSKEDLKKYFKMTKKLEQMSFFSGIELLRMHDYNRETVLEHRASQQSRGSHQNPLYWSNRDVGDWLRDIQLGEYATNLLGSGVHGALLFLERGEKSKFTADHLAHVLQLPGGKSPARKHLAQQLAKLFREEVTEFPFRAQRSPVASIQSTLSGMSPVQSPYPFSGSLYRAGSSPTLNHTASQGDRLSLEEQRIRHSLRESALRSVALSPNTQSPPSSPSPGHTPSSPSPLTVTTASGTTV